MGDWSCQERALSTMSLIALSERSDSPATPSAAI
jgi:hypothetical protein